MLGPRPARDPPAARAADRQGAGGAQGRDDGARGLRVSAARRHAAAPAIRTSRSRTRTIALLVGARPRGPGMERKDLLLENAKIFIEQGKALDAVADPRRQGAGRRQSRPTPMRYIAMKSAPSLPQKNFTAMLRLDHNRALSQLAAKSGKPVGSIEQARSSGATTRPRCIRTTASPPPTASRCKALINDEDWNRDDVHPDRRQARRGDHRGARPVVGGIGRQRGDRPRARLDARQRRQVGDDGRPVRRQLRHSRRTSCTACR